MCMLHGRPFSMQRHAHTWLLLPHVQTGMTACGTYSQSACTQVCTWPAFLRAHIGTHTDIHPRGPPTSCTQVCIAPVHLQARARAHTHAHVAPLRAHTDTRTKLLGANPSPSEPRRTRTRGRARRPLLCPGRAAPAGGTGAEQREEEEEKEEEEEGAEGAKRRAGVLRGAGPPPPTSPRRAHVTPARRSAQGEPASRRRWPRAGTARAGPPGRRPSPPPCRPRPARQPGAAGPRGRGGRARAGRAGRVGPVPASASFPPGPVPASRPGSRLAPSPAAPRLSPSRAHLGGRRGARGPEQRRAGVGRLGLVTGRSGGGRKPTCQSGGPAPPGSWGGRGSARLRGARAEPQGPCARWGPRARRGLRRWGRVPGWGDQCCAPLYQGAGVQTPLLPMRRASVWRGDLKSQGGTCLASSSVRIGQERSPLPGGPRAGGETFPLRCDVC
jgi:hypothetical protein